MKAYLRPLVLGLSFSLLTACGPKETAVVPSFSIPQQCREQMVGVTVPDFLTEEQQEQYRLANYLYTHMFGGDTIAVEEMFPLIHVPMEYGYTYQAVEEGDLSGYYLSTVAYEEFDAVVRSVFTDSFWKEKNSFGEDSAIYADLDGTLVMLELSRGAGYYHNENFSDEFRLESQTEDTISFTLIGHYSAVWPREGETAEERDARLTKEYEYTYEFPITMVLTDNGWRFDSFYDTCADEVAPEEL